jgi:hypothetical protein
MTARTGVAMQVGRVAIKLASTSTSGPGDPVEVLRRRLAGTTAREHVVLDFLADDLREARESLAVLQAYLGGIESTLAGPDVSQQKLMALSLGGGPIDQIDYLAEVLSSVRRRMAQVAARM